MPETLKTYQNQTTEIQKVPTVEIPQGEVVRNIRRGTLINAAINPGACVLGIIETGENDEFMAGHFFAGEIVKELKAMADIGDGVVVYQGPVEGEVVDLYSSGQRLTPREVKRRYRTRDLHNLT